MHARKSNSMPCSCGKTTSCSGGCSKKTYRAGGMLTGGQKRLDKNENGKLDANDFEMLRKYMSGGMLKKYMAGGMVKKYAVGGPVEGDPRKEALAAIASMVAADNAAQESGSMTAPGSEKSTDVVMPGLASALRAIEGYEMPPEESPRGENMMPVRRRGPQPIRQDLARMLIGREKEEQPREEPSSQPIMFEPTTSNVRAYTRKDPTNPDAGYRTIGGEKDAFAQGFRQDGKDMYATPKVFELMKEAGVNARDPYAMEFMKELAQKNPELFTRNQNRGAINSMVMSEVYKDPTQRGFFLQADQPVIKASF